MKKYITIGLFLTIALATILYVRNPFFAWSEPPGGYSEKQEKGEKSLMVQDEYLPITPTGKSPFVKIAKRLMPTVVSINTEQVTKVKSPYFDFFEDPFDFFKKGIPEFKYHEQEVKRPILGSGVIVSENGYILTNNHMIEKAGKITVKTTDEKEYTAKIVGTDPMTDIAIVKIEESNLPYAKLGDSDEIEIGDWVMAIGNPFQLMGTVTVGVVSAKGRSHLAIAGGGPQIQNFIQTDAAINPGNSGGPLVNLKGEIIGINTAIKTGAFPSGNIGIGFAIPSNMAKKVMEDLIQYKEVRRGWLGIYYQKLTLDLAEAYGLKETKGILVQKIIEDSPAERAGIKAEDIILEWDGKEVNFDKFPVLVRESSVGEKVQVKLWREGNIKFIWVKIGKKPTEISEKEIEEWFGIKVSSLKSEEASRFDVKEDEGVLVIEIEDGSIAERAGIRIGDVIKRVGDKEIRNLKDYENARKKYSKKKKPVVFKLKRGEIIIFVALKTE